MKRWEAIQRLEARKEFLQSSCKDCWTEEMEMALKALIILTVTVEYANSMEEYSDDNN